MSVFVVNCESVEGTKVVGVYLNEKLAKVAAKEYVDELYSEGNMKKKQLKKDSEEVRKILFIEDNKEHKVIISMSEITFDIPYGKGKKEKKDPLAPKKNLTSYMCYFKENRELIKNANPDAEFGEIGRLIGAAWKALDQDQKTVYENMSSKDKQRYENDMAKYAGGIPNKIANNLVEDDDEEDNDEESNVKYCLNKSKVSKKA